MAVVFDGMAAEAETEIAGVASAAAERTDKEQFVENMLVEVFSSGAVNGGAATSGTIGGLAKGKHGTILFLAWRPKLYTIGRKNVRALAGLKVEGLTFLLDTEEARTVRAAVSSKRAGYCVLGGLDRTYCRGSFAPLWAVPLGLEGSRHRSRDRQAALSGGAGLEGPAPLQRERRYSNPRR